MTKIFTIFIILLSFLTFQNCDESNHTIYFCTDKFIRGFDSTHSFIIPEIQFYNQVFETLLKIDQDGRTLQPNLIQDWQLLSNQLEYRLELESNIYFHDGTSLSAEHIKFSFEFQKNNSYLAPIFNLIESIIINNDSTISIWLKKPFAPFLYALASPAGILISSMNKNNNLKNSSHYSGTGPYKLASWDIENNIELCAFAGYREPTRGVKKIKYTYNPNSIDMEKTVDEKGIDILYLVTGYYIDRLIWEGKYKYFTQESASTYFIGFNVSDSLLSDIKFRKALLSALDIKKLVMNSYRGNSEIATSPLPPIYSYLYTTNVQKQFDTYKTKKVIQYIGNNKPIHRTFHYHEEQYVRQAFLELLKNMFNASNIKLTLIKFSDWSDLIKLKETNTLQLYDGAWQDDIIGDAHNFLYTLFHSKSEWNFFNLKDEKIDTWLDLAAEEFNNELRNEYYKKINNRVIELVPAIFLHHVIPHFAYNKKKIKKMVVNPHEIIQYHKMELH
jgi:peptide/nickel transport system substrate-binding protein